MKLPYIKLGSIKLAGDDLDTLLEEHGDVFPEEWDCQDIIWFCCRYVMSNITDVKEWFSNDGVEDE